MSENEQTKALEEKLFYKKKNCFNSFDTIQREKMMTFAEDYKIFLSRCKTERQCVSFIKELAESNGFTEFSLNKPLNAGDRVYSVNRGKSIMLATIGKRSLSDGISLLASHIDSPRLDLKQVPVYEDGGLCMLKTHYYGGIKKYQWTAIPLSLYGVVYKQDGTSVEISIGDDLQDAVFTVTDILPHLAKDQMKKTLAEGIEGESLNVLAGSFPFDDEDGNERVKLAVLAALYEKYGITERDLLSAELTMLPAFQPRDIGIDRSMIGAYSHDDHVCAYTTLRAAVEEKKPEFTTVCIFADKEETGSDGVTGMRSAAFEHFMRQLCLACNADMSECFANSLCMSADVTNAFDPNYASACDKQNNAFLGQGLCIVKYTGARGKADTSDAAAETAAKIQYILDKAGVCWQTGELGKVDMGGGGTVAKYLANRNIETIDAGVPVLSMHSPFEVVSKADVYAAYMGYLAFLRRME